MCTAKGKQRKDKAREVVDGPWEADQMWTSVRDVEEKEVMCQVLCCMLLLFEVDSLSIQIIYLV